MERAWDPANSAMVKQGQGYTRVYPGSPPEGKDLRPACLTLYYGSVYSEVLQWRRRLDLAKGGEHSRLRPLDGGMNRE
jgi:hypothetical protein